MSVVGVSFCAKWFGFFGKDTNNETVQLQKILYLRILLIFSLVATAAICSTLAYVILNDNEMSRFSTQYDSLSDSALKSVADSFEQMNSGLREMATTYGYNFPNAENWPNVAWPGFLPVSIHMKKLSTLQNIAFSPIVYPEKLADYEAYMKGYYLADRQDVRMPPMPGMELGQVWGISIPSLMPFHDTTGEIPGSDFKYVAPVAQYTVSDIVGPAYLSYNLRNTIYFAPVLDKVFTCVNSSTNITLARSSCSAISDTIGLPFRTLANQNPKTQDMQAQLAHPIFPGKNSTAIVGFISGAMSWKQLLIRAVPTFVSGLDCVISTSSENIFTYTFVDGEPVFKGEKDLHDQRFNRYRRTRALDTQVAQVSSNNTITIVFYPRSTLVETYTSNLPIIAAVIIVSMFLFCSAVFFAYDILMKREFGRKEAILDTKRRFVRFISHEIRTPLNTVRLGLKVLELEMSNLAEMVVRTPVLELSALIMSTTENWRHLTDDISTNSESAVEVLDDLLNYDKIEMGSLRLEVSLFNVWELTRRTTSIMQMQAAEKKIRLELTCENILITGLAQDYASPRQSVKRRLRSTCVLGDASRMGQVLRNLISNAIKFTPAGGYVSVTAHSVEEGMPDCTIPAFLLASGEINQDLLQRAGSIRISIKDSGAGLSPSQLDQICSEGVQFNANQLQAGQGSGLGLFISKGIVEQHGGTMVVASEGLGKGVTFTIEVPLYQPLANRSVSVRSMRSVELHKGFTSIDSNLNMSTDSTQFTNDIKRTLVVDDSPFNRKMLIRVLTARGFVCEQAEDGADAIKVYQEMCSRGEAPDAITMDFEMPVMNGPTATKKLRELRCTCLIVGVTGNVLPDDVQYFKSHGADHVLVKPLVVETFEELLFKHQHGHVPARIGAGSSSPGPMVLSVKPTNSPKTPAEAGNSGSKLYVQVHPTAEGGGK